MIKKYLDIITIGASGETLAFILSDVNNVLEFVVLIATLSGIIWRIFKPNKK